MEKNNETLHVLRHSASHIMAQAVQSLFPHAKLAIGPATDTGFYYDFDLDEHTFTEEDLTKIEDKMKEILKQNLTFEKYDVEDVDFDAILKSRSEGGKKGDRIKKSEAAKKGKRIIYNGVEYSTCKECAAAIGKTVATVTRWLKEGKIITV